MAILHAYIGIYKEQCTFSHHQQKCGDSPLKPIKTVNIMTIIQEKKQKYAHAPII